MSDIRRAVYRGSAIAIQVLDRELACITTHDEPYAVLSITDPLYHPPRLAVSERRRGVLCLRFSDLDERFARSQAISPYLAAFSPEMAKQATNFVAEQIADGVHLFVIHCEAGMSRSAGIAAALSSFYNGDERFFFNHYRPSVLVRERMLEALRATRSEQEENFP